MSGAAAQAASLPECLQEAMLHHRHGRLSQAENLYGQILAAVPNHPDALHLLGAIAHQQGKSERAVTLISQALQVHPTGPMHYNLGLALQAQDKLQEAAACYLEALRLTPDYAEALYCLGAVYQAQGKPEDAEERFRQALAIRPDYAEAHNNLGLALQAQGQLEQAAASYRQALAVRPEYAEAYNNLGVVLKDQGRLCLAVESFRQALNLKPDYATAFSNMGNALQASGQTNEAAASYGKALSLKPNHVEALNNLGALLKEQGKLEAAVECYRRALAIKPNFPTAHGNLANALLASGHIEAAVESYRQAIALKSDYFEAYSNLLYALSFHPRCSPGQLRKEAEFFGNKVQARARPYTRWTLEECKAGGAGAPLRVGLVSGDFRKHPVGYFLEGVLAHLNPARVVLLAYPTRAYEDALTTRIKAHCARWNPIVGLSDADAANRIYADGVHILIDLSGHTAHNRLPMFAWKPAPVQVSWLGYFATTGVPGMDYVLADPVSAPGSHQERFTETIWRLPETRLCFTPPAERKGLEVCSLPALSRGYTTFGSFQSLAKIDDRVLAIWGEILQALPGARLRLQNKQLNDPHAREHLRERCIQAGIMADRLTIEGPVQHADYLAAHAEVDLILDTFPYPGGTTTCEALWMGVPTLTLAGETMLSRQGASLLTAAGLGEWIAKDTEDYVEKAVAYAADLGALSLIRAGLRKKVLASPLFDAGRFASCLEEALYGMWHLREKRDRGRPSAGGGMGGRHAGFQEREDSGEAENVPVNVIVSKPSLQMALEHQRAGRLQQAADICRQILREAPHSSEALHLLGVIAHLEGKNDIAAELIGKAVSASAHPTSAMHYNRGLALQLQGNLDAAAECYGKAVALKPDYAAAHGNMGLVRQLQGKLDTAIESYRLALSFKPDYAVAHNNMANALKEQGNLKAAIECYHEALSWQPDYAEPYNNLGLVFQDQGRLHEAVLSYRKALALKPDYAEAHCNLGLALTVLGNLDEAVASFKKALEYMPGSIAAHNGLASVLLWKGDVLGALHVSMRSIQMEERAETKAILVECLKKVRFGRDDADVRQLLIRALSEPWERPGELVDVCVSLIKSNPTIKEVIGRAEMAWPMRLSSQELLGQFGLAPLADDLLLQCLLENAPVSELALERFLTMVRGIMLDAAVSLGKWHDEVGVQSLQEERVLGFSCSLAQQCFLNEYVFDCTAEELEKATLLREKLTAALAEDAPIPPWILAIVGAYYPLGSVTSSGILFQRHWPGAVQDLLVQQVREPLQERQYRAVIPGLTPIENEVSRLVQQQYEENPYPRWVKISPGVPVSSIDIFLHQQFPLVAFSEYGKADNLDILIAGCGTGQQSIETSQQFRKARVLAVDLSMASLCYAVRKTHQRGVKNIEYAQADIMQLGSIGRRFDIIESVGVLHHLENPQAGLGELLSLLRPHGFMRLGLYSELGRQDIVAARNFIARQGYGPSAHDIRRCRQDLLSPENISHFQGIVSARDFFGMSECRDLLFHVQEHRFTVLDLKEIMERFHLHFLGFGLEPQTVNKYRTRFPADKSMTDLASWHIFEIEHPNTFSGMYQFWVQKRT